jgi:hypothetical protein
MIHLLRVVEERRRGRRGAAGEARTNSINRQHRIGVPIPKPEEFTIQPGPPNPSSN